MKHASLFSGIGGFDLAAQWMNWTNVFHTEWNEFGQKVLQHHFPNSISYHDIIKTDYTIHKGTIDIITGGFPCQPFSHAGKRKGTDDERYLWHEMLRAIQQIQPTYVVAENVRGLLTIDGGLVFEQVCADLEAEGYEVQPILLPAASVNAPHRRDRIFIVGYAANTNDNGNSSQGQSKEVEENRCRNNGIKEQRQQSSEWTDGLHGLQRDAANTKDKRTGKLRNESSKEGTRFCDVVLGKPCGLSASTEPAANTCIERSQRCQDKGSIGRCRKESHQQSSRCICTGWQNFPTESPICGRDDGLSNRLDNITFPKWRNESIKAYGNAVVPQLILPIFQTIEKIYREKK